MLKQFKRYDSNKIISDNININANKNRVDIIVNNIKELELAAKELRKFIKEVMEFHNVETIQTENCSIALTDNGELSLA